ncbi:nucleoside triphosphate hydrolase [Georhizobium profundi]|uniref:Nucleoside triphosphate hydrolase n=1 Tax=Georhizobium profundi TaxID=2341112 RepID=A0A3S9B1F6_9HYPH|nr:nucleoside triphosphate hydrolase [Georhizobium profundi]AZN70740.1 nucleoside triphosphate hydrolase [Georhizobium profundi]
MNFSFEDLAQQVADRASGRDRFVVALAGPPGAGKSTVAERLVKALNQRSEIAALLPMDGFHLDNIVLEARGLTHRKGAPETFDAQGYVSLLQRVRAVPAAEIAVPLFDRMLDLARAGGAIVAPHHRIIVTEGNYLLVDRFPWADLSSQFDLTIWLDVDDDTLQERLIRRWLHHGLSREAAISRALDNDMQNVSWVKRLSGPADITLR